MLNDWNQPEGVGSGLSLWDRVFKAKPRIKLIYRLTEMMNGVFSSICVISEISGPLSLAQEPDFL
jgi:hypothetical protein